MFNPNAINLWILGTAVGYMLAGDHGAAIGLVATSAITLLVGFLR